jgi:pentatricopeptide repeat protein
VWDSYKQSEVGDSDRANATWVVWEEMKERGVKANETAFFNMILKATRDMDNYDRTKKTFEDMMKAGVKPNMESIELMMHDSLRNHDKATFDAISMLVKSQKSLLEPEFTQYLQVATLLAHCCYTLATLLLHCCYTLLTMLSHGCDTVLVLL